MWKFVNCIREQTLKSKNETETITVETINKNKYKKEEVQTTDGFMMFKKDLQKHFDEMQKDATHLFEVNVDKDEL